MGICSLVEHDDIDHVLTQLILGTVIFTNQPVYHWYLSTTAIFLNTSWSLHNVIAWIKNKPFLSRKASLFYIWTVALAQPYWVVEIVANVSYALTRISRDTILTSVVAVLRQLQQHLRLYSTLRGVIPRSMVDFHHLQLVLEHQETV